MGFKEASYASKLSSELFPHRGIVSLQKEFWKLVFSKYNYQTVLIHDALDVRNIIDIIPFDTLSRKLSKEGKSRTFSSAEKKQWVQKYLTRYRQAAKRVRTQGKNALKYGSMEKRIYQIYRRNKGSWNRLKQGQYKLRAQNGHADGFKKAANIAQDYLPFMEKIFRKYKVPAVLTRLAFVESMFNIEATSKVGAQGVFQFMKGTAKKYMVVNQYFDERNSPLKAARGAAKLLSDNYRALRSWPLAITAYNHGASGMKNAMHQLGTKDMAIIASKYRSKTFGFASRNFYSEFLAAVDTYQYLIETGTVKIKNSKFDNLAVVRLSTSISLDRFLRLTELDYEKLQKLNPCISDSALRDMGEAIFPKNYQLLLPRKMARSAIKNLHHYGKLSGS